MPPSTYVALVFLSACELAQQPEPEHVVPAPPPVVAPPKPAVAIDHSAPPAPAPAEPRVEDFRPQSRGYRPWKGERPKVRVRLEVPK